MVESPQASKPGANYSPYRAYSNQTSRRPYWCSKTMPAAILVFQRKPVGVGLFSCVKNFLRSLNFHRCWPLEWIRSKTHWLSQPGERGQGETFRACASVVGSGKKVYFSPTGDSLHYCLHSCSSAYELTHRRHQRMRKLNSQVERVG